MSAQPHILVIDDEAQILRALRTILTAKQFEVSVASRGEEGLAMAAAQSPDLVILDLSLPDMDGVEVCARLREWTQVPIIILSVREGERDKVIALDKGADDYLTKPFGIEELLARIRVALRHSAQALGSQKSQVIEAGPVVIDLALHTVTRAGDPGQRTRLGDLEAHRQELLDKPDAGAGVQAHGAGRQRTALGEGEVDKQLVCGVQVNGGSRGQIRGELLPGRLAERLGPHAAFGGPSGTEDGAVGMRPGDDRAAWADRLIRAEHAACDVCGHVLQRGEPLERRGAHTRGDVLGQIRDVRKPRYAPQCAGCVERGRPERGRRYGNSHVSAAARIVAAFPELEPDLRTHPREELQQDFAKVIERRCQAHVGPADDLGVARLAARDHDRKQGLQEQRHTPGRAYVETEASTRERVRREAD